MKKDVEELIRILAKEDGKRELLKEIVKSELRGMVKELLEEVAVVEREAFCESEGEVKNGFYPRDIEGFFGTVEDIKIPRTREGGFKPFFIRPYRKASCDIEDLVIAMYQGGCSTRDITRTMEILLEHRYSASWVSRMTNVIQEKVEEFQRRKIELWYPVVFLDGVVLKIRRDSVAGEVVYVALGIGEDGYKEVLGFWIVGAEGESALVWKDILAELKERGLTEPLLFIGDGLKGLAEAVKEIYPRADFQSCILHKVRNSLSKVRKKHREAVAEDIQRVYRQRDEAGFKTALATFSQEWRVLYPEVTKSWERELPYLVTYLSYPEELRPSIYTTNILERFIKEVKRRTKVIEIFPCPDATGKVMYLVASEMNERYKRRSLRNWDRINEKLQSIRMVKYGNKAMVDALCLTQNS
jgi:putative transposase